MSWSSLIKSAAITVGMLVSAPCVFAQVAPLPVPDAALNSVEMISSSRSMIEATAALASGRFTEASLRSDTSLTAGLSFPVARTLVPLLSSSDTTVPRRAFSTKDGVAFVVKLSQTTAGVSVGDPTREASYALVTATGTRLRVWAVYSELPADDLLSRYMIAAFAKIGQPLITFDPTFTAGPEAGPAKYLLK